MKRVVLESPYAGDTEKNIDYAQKCLLDSLKRGEAPIASHLLYTKVLDDNDPEQRKTGLKAGWSWISSADYLVVYTDLGISKGMNQAIDRAMELGMMIQYRRLEKKIK